LPKLTPGTLKQHQDLMILVLAFSSKESSIFRNLNQILGGVAF
jgi:hypothetical protein